MTSETCLRIQRCDWFNFGHTYPRQSTEPLEKFAQSKTLHFVTSGSLHKSLLTDKLTQFSVRLWCSCISASGL